MDYREQRKGAASGMIAKYCYRRFLWHYGAPHSIDEHDVKERPPCSDARAGALRSSVCQKSHRT